MASIASCSYNEPPDLKESTNKYLRRKKADGNSDDFSEYRRLCEVRIRRLERYKKTKSLISLYSETNNSTNYDFKEENKTQNLQNACSHGNLFYSIPETIKQNSCVCYSSTNSTLNFNNNYSNSNYFSGNDDSIFVDSENSNSLDYQLNAKRTSSCSSTDYTNNSTTVSEDGTNFKFNTIHKTDLIKQDLSPLIIENTPVNIQFEILREKMVIQF